MTGKVLVSSPQSQDVGSPLHCNEAAMVEIMDETSCPSSHMDSGSEKKYKMQLVYPESTSDRVPITSPEVPTDSTDYKNSSVPSETTNDSKVSQSSSSTNSRSRQLRFTNKKQPHNALNLSSKDYDNLLHGKNLGFYHSRSMSFMRVRTLNSKTIQTGTPHEEIYGIAEVTTSSPTPEISLQHVEQTESFEEHVEHSALDLENNKLVQEDIIFEIAKKKRISSDSAQVSMVSTIQFQFAAVRGGKNKSCGSKLGNSYLRGREIQTSVRMRKRSSISVDFSHLFCWFPKKDVVAKRTKRKDTSFFQFDDLYHPPYKKCRLTVSSSCTFTSVSWLTSSLKDSGTPGFVL